MTTPHHKSRMLLHNVLRRLVHLGSMARSFRELVQPLTEAVSAMKILAEVATDMNERLNDLEKLHDKTRDTTGHAYAVSAGENTLPVSRRDEQHDELEVIE